MSFLKNILIQVKCIYPNVLNISINSQLIVKNRKLRVNLSFSDPLHRLSAKNIRNLNIIHIKWVNLRFHNIL